ncbi:MAG TPA: butyrate kinase [Candidatus Kapabacteria bacterium]|nr:butyrate kinase [Candidatus Kapabacteria bacterium]
MKILTINPGSTSTKIAVFKDLESIFEATLRHSTDTLYQYQSVIDQFEFRKNVILDQLKEHKFDINNIDAFVGRGGLLKPISGGVYRVNQRMLNDLRHSPIGEHASNLGAIIAYEIAQSVGKENQSYIVDPVVVDEMEDIARFSGRPELPRLSIFHALNQKAVARRFARENNKNYNELTLIVAHLGGGISVGIHKNGKVIDVNNGLDGEGPFSPERSGSLPAGGLVKLCFSGKYQLHHLRKMLVGGGGMVAYLGTNSATEVEKMIEDGNEQASKVYEAMSYQIAKEIGSLATVVSGQLDGIIITGGIAYSELISNWIKNRVAFIAPVYIYPGEDELKALAEGLYYASKGELEIKEYN